MEITQDMLQGSWYSEGTVHAHLGEGFGSTMKIEFDVLVFDEFPLITVSLVQEKRQVVIYHGTYRIIPTNGNGEHVVVINDRGVREVKVYLRGYDDTDGKLSFTADISEPDYGLFKIRKLAN